LLRPLIDIEKPKPAPGMAFPNKLEE